MNNRCELADYARIPVITKGKVSKITWRRRRIWECDWKDKLRNVFRSLDYNFTEDLINKLALVYYPDTNPVEIGRRMSINQAYLNAELSVLKMPQNTP